MLFYVTFKQEKSDSDLMQVDLPLEESLIVHLSAGEERGSEQMEFAEVRKMQMLKNNKEPMFKLGKYIHI